MSGHAFNRKCDELKSSLLVVTSMEFSHIERDGSLEESPNPGSFARRPLLHIRLIQRLQLVHRPAYGDLTNQSRDQTFDTWVCEIPLVLPQDFLRLWSVEFILRILMKQVIERKQWQSLPRL